MKIKLLDEHLINQIKAGEVIESPSAMLKELIENSIDAGSTHIRISLKNNGIELLEIKDNGEGISFEELPLAFSRHATSKIESFGDIYNIYSYGFRGEALASIASVSKVSCISFLGANQKVNGGRIEFDGGLLTSHDSLSRQGKGTLISIRDLFFNTPARRKFLKSSRVIKNSVLKVLYSFILTRADIKFQFSFDDEHPVIFDLVEHNDDQRLARCKQLLSHQKKSNSIMALECAHFNHQQHDFHFYVSTKSVRSASRNQYIFVNNRLVEDKKLKAIIQRKMTQFAWEPGSSGDYFYFISLPAKFLDPNVHPSKTVIKFVFPEIVESATSHLIDLLKKEKKEHKEQNIALKKKNDHFGISSGVKEEHEHNIAKKYFELRNEQMISHKKYLFLLNEEKIQLLHKPNLLKAFIHEQYLQFNGDTLPLIIGQKLNFTPSIIFCEKIEELGFALELNKKTNSYFLKEIPIFFNDIGSTDITINILKSIFYKHKDNDLSIDIFNEIEDEALCVNDYLAKKIWKNNIIPNTNNYIRTLSDKKVDQFFNDSAL